MSRQCQKSNLNKRNLNWSGFNLDCDKYTYVHSLVMICSERTSFIVFLSSLDKYFYIIICINFRHISDNKSNSNWFVDSQLKQQSPHKRSQSYRNPRYQNTGCSGLEKLINPCFIDLVELVARRIFNKPRVDSIAH